MYLDLFLVEIVLLKKKNKNEKTPPSQKQTNKQKQTKKNTKKPTQSGINSLEYLHDEARLFLS